MLFYLTLKYPMYLVTHTCFKDRPSSYGWVSVVSLLKMLQQETTMKTNTHTKPSATLPSARQHTIVLSDLSFSVSLCWFTTIATKLPDGENTFPPLHQMKSQKKKKKKILSNRSEQCAAADVLVWYQSSRAEQHEALHLSREVCQSEQQTAGPWGPRGSAGGPWHPPTTFIPSSSLSLPLSFLSCSLITVSLTLSQRSIPIRSNSSKDMLGYL